MVYALVYPSLKPSIYGIVYHHGNVCQLATFINITYLAMDNITYPAMNNITYPVKI